MVKQTVSIYNHLQRYLPKAIFRCFIPRCALITRNVCPAWHPLPRQTSLIKVEKNLFLRISTFLDKCRKLLSNIGVSSSSLSGHFDVAIAVTLPKVRKPPRTSNKWLHFTFISAVRSPISYRPKTSIFTSIVMAFLYLLLTQPTSLHQGHFPVMIAKATLITVAEFTRKKIVNTSPNARS